MKNQDKQVKRLIAIVLIAMALTASGVIKAHAQQTIEYGYLVATSGTDRIKIHKLHSVDQVYNLLDVYFPDNCIEIEKVLKNSNYFQILTENKGFYVEKKKIVKRRKFLFGKRTGKIVFKKLKC